MEARHKKELKALDGEKRAALKKAKSTKGKKSKDIVAQLETEFAEKLRRLVEKHEQEKTSMYSGTPTSPDASGDAAAAAAEGAVVGGDDPTQNADDEEEASEELSAKDKKLAKARRKREQAREQALQRQADLERRNQEAGPSARDEEMKAICLPDGMSIVDTMADGHCLYRSIAAQVENATYPSVRNQCAESLLQHRTELEAFVETDTPYEDYVDQVRSTATWGGSLELRALALSLRRPIVVYSTAPTPLVIGDDLEATESASPIRLSYHLHYYALGAHYNQVVEKTS